MPLHKYACPDCGFEIERVVSWQNIKNDGDIRFACKDCDGVLEHVIQAPNYMKMMHKSSTLQKALTFPNRDR